MMTDAEWAALKPWERAFAHLLFERCPHLAPYARLRCWEDKAFLEVTVPRPAAGEEVMLWLATEEMGVDDEVTLGFDVWHSHFIVVGEDVASLRQTDEPLWDDLDGILTERLVAVSHWHGDTWRGSNLCDVETAAAEGGRRSGARLRVRSWRGTHDRDEPALPSPN